MYAIEWSRADLVKVLLGFGADPSRSDATGLTARDYSQGSGDDAIRQALSSPDASSVEPAEDTLWGKLNGLDMESLRVYLQSSPQISAHRTKALTYYLMQLRMADVRRGVYPHGEVIANALLGKAYADNTDEEVAAGGLYVFRSLTDAGILGVVGGGATHRSTVWGNEDISSDGEFGLPVTELIGPDWKRFAASGLPLPLEGRPHTGDGSVMGFWTQGYDLFVYGWIVCSESYPLVFGVVKKVGIVHLAGEGSLAILATGKSFEFKYPGAGVWQGENIN
jgi:hypothetical protein